ncbi:bifunctional hydroxymethylpyrimidine kinase/phosphomethylpyrimidine kinase [Myxococcota bacterium]|nr:bifunctional hydroxymethylpyrimidine kinase/phosphomethylpyrimidine kinase [Myxococcota bacterium]
MSLLVVGSVAFDDVETRFGRRERILGGSASYFSMAASRFAPVQMVAVVGDDFPQEILDDFAKRSCDTAGIERAPGKTFFWRGKYSPDFSTRTTLETQLNVFAGFTPKLPAHFCDASFLFLANIHPDLQLQVLDSMKNNPFVAGDTMNLWITTERPTLEKLVSRLQLITVNDEEARQLTGQWHLLQAGRAIQKMGPRTVILKKGEHGAMLFHDDELFFAPAFPLASFVDPTGAGDTFAGGFMGSLARDGVVNSVNLRRAMFYGTVAASHTVEQFSVDGLRELTIERLDERFAQLVDFTKCEN